MSFLYIIDGTVVFLSAFPRPQLECTAGAVFMAGEQYGEEVRVIDVPGVSMELCGGTHVTQTAQIGAFKILSESGIASGVRRVEAVAGPAAVDHLDALDSIVKAIGKQLKAKNEDLPARVTGMLAKGYVTYIISAPLCNSIGVPAGVR